MFKTLVDREATINAISTTKTQELNMKSCELEKPYTLGTVAARNVLRVNRRALPLTVRIQGHEKKLVFDIVDLADYDVILGDPWLEKHNPAINWKQKTLEFDGCACVSTPFPRADTASTADKDEVLCITHRIRRRNSPGRSVRHRRKRTRVKKDRKESNDELSKIPKEYQQWLHLFKEKTGPSALPKHQPWDHEIELMPGETPKFGPLYKASAEELKFLKKYLNEMLKKRQIRKSKSPASSPIIFIPKPDGKGGWTKRPCIDFRKLNSITVKNRYPIFNI